MRPPTIHELLEDPGYRKYIRQIPRLSENMSHGEPWIVWARTTDDPPRWAKKMCVSYRDAWALLRKGLDRPDRYSDIAIVSRRKLFAPPDHFQIPWGFEWCGLCRRPTKFSYRPDHHALRNAVAVATEDANRCYYDGSRRIFSSWSFLA